jgi:hypothetical protein
MWLMPRRLLVINGADEGRFYSLADDGVRTVGSSHRHADILLNDLYVSRVHCQLKVEGDLVLLTAMDNCPTLVNGTKISEQALSLGDVMRIGNSHLRFEIAEFDQTPPTAGEGAAAGVALEEPGFEVIEEQPARPAAPRRVRVDELARHTLGHYEIRAALGQGHCGVVFQARDQKSDQLVALKVLSPDFPQNDEEMKRFVRVMRSALPVRHAQLVSTLGAGRSGAYCWIAQEYVDGETVSEVIERIGDGRKIKWKRALHIAMQITLALEYTHRQGLVHGNITPENILIRREDKDAKLGDLMLRKALEGSRLYEGIREKKCVAELPYTPPEMLEPGATPDIHADLYSLGAITYALLTGQPPFAAKSTETLRAQIREALPEKPRHLQKHIPSDLQAIVLKLMAKRPEDRFATPAELHAGLHEFVAKHEEE